MAKKPTKNERLEAFLEKDNTERVKNLTREMTRMKNLDPLTFQQSVIKNRIKELREDLPHLYGWKFYPWAREFFESRNRMNLLCAANQIGKSSIAIRKNIEWACNKKLWKDLWATEPKQFWYFYPSDSVATVEVEKKWIPEFMPRGDMKDHEDYGWDLEYKSGDAHAIHFRSGVSIYFKSYGQKTLNLQTSSVHMITADEEMPEEHLDELLARLRATRGYFNQVFTATRGLQIWYRAMECIGSPEEMFIQAWKRSVSMRDCRFYDDGSASPWTEERIREAESFCSSKSEVLKRIDGRFVKDEGRRYLSFDPDNNILAYEAVPKNWRYYAGVDIGSGGKGRSAGAVVVIAVNPEFTKGRVIKTWRGDYEETTARDILDKYRELTSGLSIVQACYDYQSREFGLIASRSGEPFVPADKSRDSGEAILNTLWQSVALTIDDGATDNRKLVTELMSVPAGVKNRKFQDDLTDALRYVAKLIPWDFPLIAPGSGLDKIEEKDDAPKASWTEAEYQAWEIRQRRGESDRSGETEGWQTFRDEIDAWNDLYGG
jgi:hypothetical protein